MAFREGLTKPLKLKLNLNATDIQFLSLNAKNLSNFISTIEISYQLPKSLRHNSKVKSNYSLGLPSTHFLCFLIFIFRHPINSIFENMRHLIFLAVCNFKKFPSLLLNWQIWKVRIEFGSNCQIDNFLTISYQRIINRSSL